MRPTVLRNEKGLAMILAISLIGLLTGFGIWMITESGTAFRITSAMTRRTQAVNLADGALQLSLLATKKTESDAVLTYDKLTGADKGEGPQEIDDDIKPEFDFVTYPPDLSSLRAQVIPEVYFVDYSEEPPPGWQLNNEGYTSHFSVYYKNTGEGHKRLREDEGDARSRVYGVSLKVE